MRSRWDGGCECSKQTWCAREASCGVSGLVPSGNLHTVQSSGTSGFGGGVASADAGADCIARVGGDGHVGVFGDVFGAVFMTIER